MNKECNPLIPYEIIIIIILGTHKPTVANRQIQDAEITAYHCYMAWL